jgi:protein-S-isoprenylcysteine O-methyltransferase Ste14
METNGSSYTETSVHAGSLLVALGVGIWLLHYAVGIFTGWGWAAAIGSLWIVLGSLFLFSDVRVYQFDRSPVERLLVESEER